MWVLGVDRFLLYGFEFVFGIVGFVVVLCGCCFLLVLVFVVLVLLWWGFLVWFLEELLWFDCFEFVGLDVIWEGFDWNF